VQYFYWHYRVELKGCGAREGACVAFRPSSCQRISEHRVRCGFFITLDEEDGSRDRCLNLIEWSIQGESPSLHPHYLGIRSCTQLRPPEAQ
jgi:hypothetical protein